MLLPRANALRGARLLPLFGLLCAAPAAAQQAPAVGYVYPLGGRAGTTLNVRLAGYDWTPDMQFFVHDPRVKLEIVGPPGPILVPPPPYWFGPKSYSGAAPLPREVPARLTLPAGMAPGPLRWQAANANGGTTTGVFLVSDGEEAVEAERPKGPQPLPVLPVTVSGRLSRIEEVDRYRFTVPRAGPVTLELTARRLGSDLNAVLEVRDAGGALVADAADTEGLDTALTFAAKAGTEYTASLHDVDFRGDFAFLYRLRVSPGPRVLAALPAAGRRGETRQVEFLLDAGAGKLERVTRPVAFPADPTAASFDYRLDTPSGAATPYPLLVTDLPEMLESASGAAATLSLPGAVTGTLDERSATDRYEWTGTKGDVWKIAVEARGAGALPDLALRLLSPDGKELAKNDDLPGTTDAGLEYTVPADGKYTLEVTDMSGQQHPAAVYRLSVERPAIGFDLRTVQGVNVLLGGTADLVVKVTRRGGFKEPVALTLAGLPDGMTAPDNLVIPAGMNELKIPLTLAPDAAVVAALVTVTGTATVDGKPVTRTAMAPAAGNLAPRAEEAELASAVLVAGTMKPRCKLEPVDKDGGRTVHRGTTYPAEVIVGRLEGFTGEIGLWMAAKQDRHRQGIRGPEFTVSPGVTRIGYPCFMPEWLETSRTSRMILIGVTKVPDPKGNVRYLVSPMDGRITMSMEGALLKVSHAPEERTVRAGQAFRIPIKIGRSAKLPTEVRLELLLPEELAGMLNAETVVLPPDKSEAEFAITST
ncbi:MAG TPA: PPC domain-containing protein, partial [Armatimonadota bacterium]|nr:PPC domain-containing protein [Armatimonadota bacterium]